MQGHSKIKKDPERYKSTSASANPEKLDLCFDNTARDMGTESRIQQPHNRIPSLKLGLR